MKTTVQTAWIALAFAMFILALVGLRSIGHAEYGGYAMVASFFLAWITWRAYH